MKKLIAVLILSLGIYTVQAQEVYTSSGRNAKSHHAKKQTGYDPSRLIFGGGLGLGFGSGMFYGSISPVVGYAITDHFSAGVGLSYQYYSNKNELAYDQYGYPVGYYNRKSSLYSGSLWARYIIWKNLFAQVQPELLNTEDYSNAYIDNNNTLVGIQRVWVPAALVGLGIRQPIAPNASLVLLAMYDVLQDSRTPYYQTIDIRFGFNIGF
jgi:hypothetical protein